MGEPINTRTVGTCGNCGGPVVVPTCYMSVIKPVPTCARCGSVAKPDHGPVMPMGPKPRYERTDWDAGGDHG